MPMRTLILLGFSLALLLTLGACRRPPEFQGTAYDPPRAAPAIVGTNWDGSEFHIQDLRGKVTILLFGYTFCPDVCPMTLARLQQFVSQLGDQADEVAVVLVSVDPSRDSPERLAQYVPAFHPDFFGVHVPEPDLATVKQGYGIFAERSDADTEEGEEGEDYNVDHTSGLFLSDRTGRLRVVFGHDPQIEVLNEDIQILLDE